MEKEEEEKISRRIKEKTYKRRRRRRKCRPIEKEKKETRQNSYPLLVDIVLYIL